MATLHTDYELASGYENLRDGIAERFEEGAECLRSNDWRGAREIVDELRETLDNLTPNMIEAGRQAHNAAIFESLKADGLIRELNTGHAIREAGQPYYSRELAQDLRQIAPAIEQTRDLVALIMRVRADNWGADADKLRELLATLQRAYQLARDVRDEYQGQSFRVVAEDSAPAYSCERGIMTAEELDAHRTDSYGRNYAESDDGYSDMDAESKRRWRALADWGADGWNLGSWPYVVIYTRDSGERFELMQIVEGDRTVYAFDTESDRTAAIDYLFLWYAAGEDWSPITWGQRKQLDAGLIEVDPRFRGPYRHTPAERIAEDPAGYDADAITLDLLGEMIAKKDDPVRQVEPMAEAPMFSGAELARLGFYRSIAGQLRREEGIRERGAIYRAQHTGSARYDDAKTTARNNTTKEDEMTTKLRELLTNDDDFYFVRRDEDPGGYGVIQSEMLLDTLTEEELDEPAEWDQRTWTIRLVREIGQKPAKYERLREPEIQNINESGEYDPWTLAQVEIGESR